MSPGSEMNIGGEHELIGHKLIPWGIQMYFLEIMVCIKENCIRNLRSKFKFE